MARTKQTARKTLMSSVAHKKTSGKGCTINKPNRYRPALKGKSVEPIAPVVNTQQFSLRFDDQEICQKRAVPPFFLRCKTCQSIFTKHSVITSLTPLKKKKLTDAQKAALNKKTWSC